MAVSEPPDRREMRLEQAAGVGLWTRALFFNKCRAAKRVKGQQGFERAC